MLAAGEAFSVDFVSIGLWRYEVGAFFICGDDGENFCSLTDRQVQRYLERFRQPEIIFDSPVGIVAMPCGPDQYARFMQAARGDGGGEPPARRNRPTR